jgi:hypothetical protein
MTKPFRYILIIWYFSSIVLFGGCATRFVNTGDAKEALTYDDLKNLFGRDINCREKGIYKECFYHYESFNLFNLENRSQRFYFLINKNGEVKERKVDETFTEYHIIPPTKLPDAFKEFE